MRYSNSIWRYRLPPDLSSRRPTYQLISDGNLVHFVASGVGLFSPLMADLLERIRSDLIGRARLAGMERVELSSLASADHFSSSPRLQSFEAEFIRTSIGRMLLTPCVEEWAVHLWLNGGPRRHAQVHFFDVSRRFRDAQAKRGVTRMREFEVMDVVGVVHNQEQARASNQQFRQIVSGTTTRFGITTYEVRHADDHVSTFFGCQGGEHRLSLQEGATPRELQKGEPCPVRSRELVVSGLAFAGRIATERMPASIAARFASSDPATLLTYTVGLMRVAHAYLESARDEQGFALRRGLRPFDVGLVSASERFSDLAAAMETLYGAMKDCGISPFYDDRSRTTVAEKAATCWFLGCACYVLAYFEAGSVGFSVHYRSGSTQRLSSVSQVMEVVCSLTT